MVKQSDARIVLIGAGSVSFGLSIMGDLMTTGFEPLEGATIVFHDIDEVAIKRTTGVFKKAMQEAGEDGAAPAFKVEATTDPKKALQDANYAIMSIEHGNRVETWMQDYYIPRKFGCSQIYGENGGPGGMFHTWRQIPPMLKICETMQDVCPKAWLFNYSNPVPRITNALSKATKIKAVGLCHGVMAGMMGMAAILGQQINDIDFICTGLNHFYWITKSNAKVDLTLPQCGPYPETKIAKGGDLLPEIRKRGIVWAQNKELPLIEEVLRTYGYLTYPSQSHPGEYLHWADAYCPNEKYNYHDFAKQGYDMKAHLDRTIEGKDHNYWWVKQSGERAVDVICGIEHDTNQYERAVNWINHGAISNLPDDVCVEVPFTVNKQGIHMEKIGALPSGIAQLCQREAALQSICADAAISGDYNTAIQALCMDPTVPSPTVARSMFDEILKVQGHLLPQFTKKQ